MTAFIRLYSGILIDVLNPNPGDITVEDIAHALSCQGRFSGHTKTFFPVSEHSINVCTYLKHDMERPDLAKCGLFHDGTEAYLVDMPSPVKNATEMGDKFKTIEHNIWKAIAERFSLPKQIPEEVKYADRVMLVTEMRDLMNGSDWEFESERLGVKPWTRHISTPTLPAMSETAFKIHYDWLTNL